MSDIHVLDAGAGSAWQCVFHVAIPDAANQVSVSYRTALVNSGIGGTTVLEEGTGPGQISTAEKAAIEAGEVYECVVRVRLESGGTQAGQLRATVRACYLHTEDELIAALQRRLRYYGYEESKT